MRGWVVAVAVLVVACAPPEAASWGTIEVRASDAVGEVYVDARARGDVRSVSGLEVPAGTHVVELRAASLVVASATVEVRGGDRVIVDLDRAAIRSWAGDAAVPAQLEVRSEPTAAETLVDGERAGLTPLHVTVAPGTHHVAVRADGHEPHEELIELPAGGATTLDVTLSPSR